MTLFVIFYSYHFVRTILSMPFCPIPFCPYTILSNTILSVYHFVHTILSVPFCPLPFCPRTHRRSRAGGRTKWTELHHNHIPEKAEIRWTIGTRIAWSYRLNTDPVDIEVKTKPIHNRFSLPIEYMDSDTLYSLQAVLFLNRNCSKRLFWTCSAAKKLFG